MIKSSLRYIMMLISAMLILPWLVGCNDDFDYNRAANEDGIPIKVVIPMTSGAMTVKSRAEMAEGRDNEINTIWLAFFYENGNLAKDSIIVVSNSTQTDLTTDISKGTFEFDINSGKYKIAAVANPRGNYGITASSDTTVSLETLLTNLTTYSEYENIAYIQNAGDVSTPTGNLVMQGVYMPDADDHSLIETSDGIYEYANKSFAVPGNAPQADAGYFTLPGKIHFRRILAHVNFRFGYNATNIKSFEPVSVTVSHVPMTSWLAERKDDDRTTNNSGDALSSSYTEYYHESPTLLGDQMGTDGNYRTVDWYQLENRRTGNAQTYATREEEIKNADGTNSGIYRWLRQYGDGTDASAANQMATFVTFNVRMVMVDAGITPSGNVGQSRTVDAKYTIHLGAVDNDYTDYNCNRNTNYTYTVTINDINKIEIEARRESQTEYGPYQHGAEGVVTVITAAYMYSDAHFSAFNVQLTPDELEDFQWSIHTPPMGGSSTYEINQDNYGSFDKRYWSWVEFRPTTGQNVIAAYKPYSGTNADGYTYNLHDMTTLVDDGKADDKGWYTVYLNEYVYEDPDGDNGVSTPNWKGYVNLADRTVWLKVEEKRSTDGESIIYGAKYAIAQKSIQTYYSELASGPSAAVGVEHSNENYGESFSSSSYSGSYTDSRKISWHRLTNGVRTGSTISLSGKLTSTPANTSNQNGVVSYVDKQYTAVQGCLNRNRDLNGNGVIDIDEFRWFVPTDEQYVQIVMGQQALATPLYSYNGLTEGSLASDNLKHYAGVNHKILWAEEGMSTGGYPEENDDHEIRCVRYLGINMKQLDVVPDKAYSLDADNKTITFDFADEAYRAASFYNTLPVHNTSSEYSKPYRKIEYKTNLIAPGTTFANWFTYLGSNNPCSAYNTGGETGWRVPNQCEVAAMFFLKLYDTSYHLLSGTRTFFQFSGESYRILASYDKSLMYAMDSRYFSYGRIRCVRDVR